MSMHVNLLNTFTLFTYSSASSLIAESAYRIDVNSKDQLNLPNIPVHPVSSDDAFHIMS